VLVPFAAPICTSVDVDGRRIVIDPPDGLLEVNRRAERP
jgi:ribosomal 30S subunit maturation factor RimM